MESLRDVKRVMEREIVKGSCPLTFERLELPEKPLQFIRTEEKLDEVLTYLLRIGEFKQYAEKTVINNVYMDMDLLCRKPEFRRTHSVMERKEIYQRIQRYKKRLRPDYEEEICLETVNCIFHLPEDMEEQYKIIYNGQETYGFIMSNKYILGLFTYCEVARKAAFDDKGFYNYLLEREFSLLPKENVRDILFQCLLLDNVKKDGNLLSAELCTVYCMKDS